MVRNRHIETRRKTAAPISYTGTHTRDMTKLAERSSLLDKRVVEGYGVIWGTRNEHGEVFTKGCFTKSIKEHGPEAQSNYSIKFRDEHGKACSLFAELREDEVGLYFKTTELDNVQWANDLLVQLRSGTINNFSIGFRHIWDKVEWDDDTNSMIVLEARLFEISAVAIPSDKNTFVVRADDELEYLQDDTEDFIISLPKSKQLEARKIIARHISLAARNEPDSKTTKKPLKSTTKPKKAIDYKFLTKNI